MANERKSPKLDKKTLERISREWDKLPRGNGAAPGGGVGAITTPSGDIAVVKKPGQETQIITSDQMTSDLN